ncbi:pectin acetylesterase-family hydrolase [Microbacterium hominis]|uniref:Pectin acetylesterase n=1 Tax=Microbacterium hominis TaxID=162426 RepID=A0A7D4Q1J6_9MICO|nr:pectin acetylesterase-family hydrolase [Microbacterium hominis]QKJ18911.1 pectin acetylesterase [Microbacterium hominis]
MSSSTGPTYRDAPLATKILAPLLRARQFPALPASPRSGKWYRIAPPGAVSANGDVYHGSVRIGSENKLIIMFHGGGVSWNEYMAAHPASMYRKPTKPNFYASESDLIADLVTTHGVGSRRNDNPFRDWSMISISYSSGDFHTGTADFPYTDASGEQQILHHHGYSNYRAVMSTAIEAIGAQPEQIVVTGFSAGGFGAALLTDDVMTQFPNCSDVTCCVDGGFMLYDGWRDAASTVWGAPSDIVERLHSENITLDALTALHRDHPHSARVLFISSTRDHALAEYWPFVAEGVMRADRASGDAFQRDLAVMCRQLQAAIPDTGIFIYDTPVPANLKDARAADLTQHCIISSRQADKVRVEGKTPLGWLWDAVNGHPATIGLSLLDDAPAKSRP